MHASNTLGPFPSSSNFVMKSLIEGTTSSFPPGDFRVKNALNWRRYVMCVREV